MLCNWSTRCRSDCTCDWRSVLLCALATNGRTNERMTAGSITRRSDSIRQLSHEPAPVQPAQFTSSLRKFGERRERVHPHVRYDAFFVALYLFACEPAHLSTFHLMPRVGAVLRAREVARVDMFVGTLLVEEVPIEKTWWDELASTIRRVVRVSLSDELDIEPCLLFGLANSRFIGVFVEFDVSAGREPNAEHFVYVEQYLVFVHDVYAYRKIDFFVDVRHDYCVGFRIFDDSGMI